MRTCPLSSITDQKAWHLTAHAYLLRSDAKEVGEVRV
jgi:hypothetical protein